MTKSNAALPDPGHLLEEFQAYQRSLALRTALELELFTQIGAGTTTAAALAARCGAAERGVRILCDYLTVTGHLRKESEHYRLTLNSTLYLSKASPAYIGSAAEYLAGDAAIRSFADLPRAVRNGGRIGRAGDVDDPMEWVSFAECMAPLAEPVAAFAATSIKLDRTRRTRVLDIAAGHGHYGLAVAARYPKAQIFALDFPSVLEVAARNASAAGAEDRYHLIPGDALGIDLGGPYDLIVIANFVHHLDATENTLLFRKCRAVLRPRGQLLVIDFFPNADRVSPPADAAFALTLLASTARGDVYTFEDLARLLRSADFRSVRQPELGGLPRWVVIARAGDKN